MKKKPEYRSDLTAEEQEVYDALCRRASRMVGKKLSEIDQYLRDEDAGFIEFYSHACPESFEMVLDLFMYGPLLPDNPASA